MYNHAPHNYACPFCSLLRGHKNKDLLSVANDIFYRDEDVCAMISSHQWPNNHGHTLVFPIRHYENIYDLPVELGGKIHVIAQKIALGMKSRYGCDGISTRQHNEPAGNQDVWHYHLHVFPRYANDQLYTLQYNEMPAEARAEYANLLRDYFRRTVNEP